MEYGVLGPLEVRNQDGIVVVASARQRTLLAVLLLNANEVVSSDRLIDDLWHARPPATARTALQVHVSQLRKALGDGVLETRAPGYLLHVEQEELDLHRFDRLLAEGTETLARDPASAADALRQALALWRGPALADLAFEPFAALEAARLEELRLVALERRIEADLALGREQELVPELERLVGEHRLRESFRAQLMLALYRSGRQSHALEEYRNLRKSLVDELGVEPGRVVRELHRAILLHDPALDLAAADGRESGSKAPPLPLPATTFVGRQHELEEIDRLLAEGRLVTLTGTGGAGKTRLALEAARRGDDRVRGAVFLAQLASLEDPRFVSHAIATAIGLPDEPARSPVAAIVDHLRSRRALLVLDNCEHVLEAAGAVAEELVAASPGLRILATSREPLGVAREAVLDVPPLLVPDPDRLPPTPQLLQYESMRLFVERARVALSSFAFTAETATAVAQVCRAVGGLPLAIELAAARVATQSVDEIAARLEDQLSLLAVGTSATPLRHRTLRKTIDWSYDLLSERERLLFERLSVFVGGFTPEAAQVVSGKGIEAAEVPALLEGLRRKSLLTERDEGVERRRYVLLEPLRRYAAERLDARGDADRVRDDHANYFVALAELAEPELHGRDQAWWFRGLTEELDNVRAALAWTELRDIGTHVRLVGALWWFWTRHPREGRRYLERVETLDGEALPAYRARALNAVGVLFYGAGDYERAATAASEALALARELRDGRGAGIALTTLGSIERDRGSFERATAFHQQAISSFAEASDGWGVARSLYSLGYVELARRDDEAARDRFDEALAGFREIDDPLGVAISLHRLSELALVDGDRDDARAMLEESLVALRLAGNEPGGVADCLSALGDVAFLEDDLEHAEALFREALALRAELGEKLILARVLEQLAKVAAAHRRLDEAGMLSGAAERLREDSGVAPAYSFDPDLLRVADTQASMSAFESARARGRTLSLDEAVAYALEENRTSATGDSRSAS